MKWQTHCPVQSLPYAPSAQNVAPILRTDACDFLAITFGESQVTEIDLQGSSVECRMPEVLGARTNESPRWSDDDVVAAMNGGHHQHIMVMAGMLPY